MTTHRTAPPLSFGYFGGDKMGVVQSISDFFSRLLNRRAKELFGVKPVDTEVLTEYLDRCARAYRGDPDWLNDDDDVVTINFAQTVSSEVARLATMNAEITVTGSPRADWLQGQVNNILEALRQWCEYGCAGGTVIMKPYGNGTELVFPDRFRIVGTEAGKITGVVFIDRRYDPASDRWFTRLEYHRIEDGIYTVSNRYFRGVSERDEGKQVAMEVTPWVDDALADDAVMEGADRLLFGVFRTPAANNKDPNSLMGLPIFSSALEELKDLDVAYSRNATEIVDSKRLVLLDSDRLFAAGAAVPKSGMAREARIKESGLPKFVKAVEGSGSMEREIYHEINPSLNTEMRLKGINSLLSQIGFKCGFSNGYFVFNEKTGMVTATQVESDDRRTLQLVNDVRKALQSCLDDVIYSLNWFADAYGLVPRGEYETAYNFADLTLNEEEDKARWWGYVLQGKVPFWYYLTKFEGYTEEEAKELEAMSKTKEPELAPEE